jgi:archaellum component FlaC
MNASDNLKETGTHHKIEKVDEIMNEVKGEIKGVNKNIQKVDEEIKQVRGEIKDVHEKIEKVNEKIEKVNEKIENVNEEIKRVNEKIEKVNEKFEKVILGTAEYAKVDKEDRDKIRPVVESELSRLKAFLGYLCSQLAGLNADKVALRSQLAGWNADKVALRSELAELKNEKRPWSKLAEEQIRKSIFNFNPTIESRIVSRHKEDRATVDGRRILTSLAEVFFKDYELNVKKGSAPTFGNVLYGLGDEKNGRPPRAGVTQRIQDRIKPEAWEYSRKWNSLVNQKVHDPILPTVNGTHTLVLHELVNSAIVEEAMRDMSIIKQDQTVRLQNPTDFSSPLGSDTGGCTPDGSENSFICLR